MSIPHDAPPTPNRRSAGGEDRGAVSNLGQPDADASWCAFEAALAAVLAEMDEDECLILTTRPHDHWVRFAALAAGAIGVETVSDTCMIQAEHRLSDAQRDLLWALGWDGPEATAPQQEPLRREGGDRKLYLEAEAPVPFDALARLACASLRCACGVRRPRDLTYRAFHRAGDRIRFPTLQLEHESIGGR